MLPLSFKNYFVDLNKIHKHNIRQKSIGGCYHHTFDSEFGRKRLHHACLKERESTPLAQKNCSYAKFKNNYKSVVLELNSINDVHIHHFAELFAFLFFFFFFFQEE